MTTLKDLLTELVNDAVELGKLETQTNMSEEEETDTKEVLVDHAILTFTQRMVGA